MKLLKVCLYVLFLINVFLHNATFTQEKKVEKEEKKKKPKKITEEILVIGKKPEDLSISTVNKVDSSQLENLKPLDLSEAIKFSPGVNVTFGDKNVYTLKLRGMDSRRIVLLIDGIPVYEPFFSTFDLKTVTTEGIDSLQITKGPSSVLYGPNTLGGIVNVITMRPKSEPSLKLSGSYGEKAARSLSIETSFQMAPFALAASVLYQDSDGFFYPAENSNRKERENSDYQRVSANFKLYYTPSSNTEILLNGGMYLSEYGMPPGLETTRPRYWRFKNWDRYSLNLGGFTAIGQNSTLRFRTFFVQYNNTLDQYINQEMSELKFESTHNNLVYGAFVLGDFPLEAGHSIKLSLNYKKDQVKTQDDIDQPWNNYEQQTFSAGFENHYTIFEKLTFVAGLSFDYLDKFIGENSHKINPLLGFKYSVNEPLAFHFSFSRKSKFPSMRSMYSNISGNPDLLSEAGYNVEAGYSYQKNIVVNGAFFLTRFKDMIDMVRLPDNTRRFINIHEAYINGFELQIQKTFQWIAATLNYTFLNHKNKAEDRPLDALPNHTFNFDLQLSPKERFRIGLYGVLASSSSWFDFSSMDIIDIPSYFNLDCIVAYRLKDFEIFLKISNVFDVYYYTEPGFPWRGRYFEFGIKADILK